MRFLLLGGSGQVGTEFRALPLSKNIEIVPPEPNRARHLMRLGRDRRKSSLPEPWSAVINAAAYTDVDLAENEESAAFAINAEAPARLATETGRRGIPADSYLDRLCV